MAQPIREFRRGQPSLACTLGVKNMKKHIVPNPRPNGPLGVRGSIWLMLCGGLLTCLVLIKMSGHYTQPAPQIPRSEAGQLARRESPIAPVGDQPVHQLVQPRAVSGADMQPLSPEVNPAISNELSQAREKLKELRSNYGEQHPKVREQTEVVASLERSALTPDETLELARARADLAKLQASFGPNYADLQAQRQFVEGLEQSIAAGESSELAQAKAQLAKLRASYGDQNSEVQAQLEKVAQLQR